VKRLATLVVSLCGLGIIAFLTKGAKVTDQPKHCKYASCRANGITNDKEQGSVAIPPQPHGWDTEQQSHHSKERIYWFASIFLTFVAGIAAIVAACYAGGVFEQARRQADAAEKNIPRSWLYVEIPQKTDMPSDQSCFAEGIPVSPFTCTRKLPPLDGKRRFWASFTFSIHNYGRIPATIKSVSAVLYLVNSESEPNFAFDAAGAVVPAVSVTDASGTKFFSGKIISSETSLVPPPAFPFYDFPDPR
jgi:hypothetical protein